MHQLKVAYNRPYLKSARVVGDVIGKYHPHGDSAVYDALVRLAQNFAMRYPLVDGQGNFGSIDGDSPAAMRYTEVRMARLTSELLNDLEKETIDWTLNYDEKEHEPSVLPTRVPNLLLNGAVGIAVGMATNIPPHNLTELIDACLALIDEPKLPDIRLFTLIKGPDFPTGGLILGRSGILQAYRTGRGGIVVRARCRIEEDEKGREAIIVSEIPYQVNKTRLIEKIAELVREKRLEGISDIQDYSDRTGMRIWIQIKRDASAQIVLNALYKNSELQTTFGVNLIAIVKGRPQVLCLRECSEHFIDHRRTVVTRRCRFELKEAVNRRELVEGLGVAGDAIDRIIAIIRGSANPDDARDALMAEPLQGYASFLERCGRPIEEIETARAGFYRLNERQARAILDMRLQRLTGLEREKVEGEYRELCTEIARLQAILTDPVRLMGVIRGELVEIRTLYGDPAGQDSGNGAPEDKGSRRTQIIDDAQEIQPIDLVADESMVVMMTQQGYIKRMPTSEYRVQARGGVGVKGNTGRDDDDFVVDLFEASAHSWVLMFTNNGRVFKKRVFELPLGRRESKGKALVNFLELRDGETVKQMLPYREDEVSDQHFVVLTSKQGYIKRTALDEFTNIRASGLIAATIPEDDQIIGARITKGDAHVFIASRSGMAIRFPEDEVRPMGRTARGVKGMGLREGDEVVSMLVLAPDSELTLLTLCARGYGKRTLATEYRPQSRAGLGLITIKTSERNGDVVGVVEVAEDQQLMVVTNRGKVIRTPVRGISVLGRSTQGVRVMRLNEGESVSVMEVVGADKDEREGSVGEESLGEDALENDGSAGDVDASDDGVSTEGDESDDEAEADGEAEDDSETQGESEESDE